VNYQALSLKQPWAALLAHGHKTIEVRRWRTHFRGLLLIHAAHVSDDRPEAWAHVPPELRQAAMQVGGIVGVGRLDDCKPYLSLAAFAEDQARHLNDPTWFEAQGLFGLCFSELHVLPYRRVAGYMRIFKVDLDLEIPPIAPVAEADEGAPTAVAREEVRDRLETLIRDRQAALSRPRRQPDTNKE
jgi:hypothetical protein